MKVKIGDKIYDADEEPIMLIFEGENQVKAVAKHLSEMASESKKYCMFPSGMEEKIIREFMKTE
jgi:hypothetical protein